MLEVSLNFLVVFFILWILVFVLNKIFFGPVRRIRDQRRDELKRNRESARRALEKYDRTVEQLEQALKAARAQAEQERESLSAAALQEKAQWLGDLGAEHRRNVDKAKEDLGRALTGLKQDMDSQVETIARKIEERLLP